MEPKDLKSSGELKSMLETNNKNAEKNIAPVRENSKQDALHQNENKEHQRKKEKEISDLEGNSKGKSDNESVSHKEVSSETDSEKEKNNSNNDREKNNDSTDDGVEKDITTDDGEVINDSTDDVEERSNIKVGGEEKKDPHEFGEEKNDSKEVETQQTDSNDTGEEKQSRSHFQKVPIPGEQKKPINTKSQSETSDYYKYSLIELVNALRNLLDKHGDKDIKREVETIKAAFYKKLKAENEITERQFIEEGGRKEDFQVGENPYENDISELLKRYRQIRTEYHKKLEKEKEINLQVKYEVIEEIKALIHKEESINKTFQEFRDLQKRWREIGLVPQSKVKDLWDTYHFHVEKFYDYIKINQELRDLDLKKNLEMKIRLCEQAEELLLEPNIIKAFNALQKLHERWREIGPVPREHKDDIWERFKVSTTKINKKHQEYFEYRKAEQKKNLEAKRALCEQVEEINELELSTHKEWSERSKEVINLQKVWRTIGFAPRKDNNKIYSRFRSACDKFFDAKRDFYAQNKELQQNNLQMKIDLCVQAEALKDSTDWRKTTKDLITIQKQWKEIGPVPRKQSDALWKRFRAACDYFFEKKANHFSNIDAEQNENLSYKEKLIEDVQNFEATTGNVDEKLNKMKEFQRRWTEIGHVPIKKKDAVQKKFREAINKLFDDLNIDESERNLLKFKTKLATFSESSRGQEKIQIEREKYINKLKQLENDLILLDNNIGFFAKSKKTESLIEDVKRKIEQTKEKIEFLKEKIRVIDDMDQEED